MAEPHFLECSLAQGPRLVQWVARCADSVAARAALLAGGIDCGELQQAERATPHGVLRWQISVRADGRCPLGGAAPALIEWGAVHPTDAMGETAVALQTVRVSGWPEALKAWLPDSIVRDEAAPGAPPLAAVLSGPRGAVTLRASD